MEKTIAVVGLGLIGGSMAKAIKATTTHKVVGFDIKQEVLNKARNDDTIDMVGTDKTLAMADVVLLSLYPQDIINFVDDHIDCFKKGCILIDLCGVKTFVCHELDKRAATHNLVFVGGHPMAGREFSGYDYALATLFVGSSMILTPTSTSTPEGLKTLTNLFSQLGFTKVVQTTPQHHDRMIAFTSQLAHVVSSAYIKSPEALNQQGYSAGSYKDLTRVAKLNEHMWTELFLKNQEPLVNEIDEIIAHLTEYRTAIANNDSALLKALLKDGRERKEQIG